MLGNLNVKNARITGDLLIMQFGTGTANTAKELVELVNKKNLNKKQTIITVKEFKKSRSLSANGYMWLLCDKLAQKIKYITKEDVYRNAVRQAGKCMVDIVKKEAFYDWEKLWSNIGTGWFLVELGDSDVKGYVDVEEYIGSSEYNSEEMARLIDYIVQECKEHGIETMPPEELKSLCEAWGK